MKQTKYRIDEFVGGYNEYKTPCQFGEKNPYTDEIRRVGRGDCVRCRFFDHMDTTTRTVYCNYNQRKAKKK
nr:hypothetical protein WMHIBSEC_WMHIBSEC_CDS_0061 [Caudoviricetes sp.]CAI9751806.1 hypothetical protein AZFZUZMX_AZFZUZMX_CDS_0061 [Caudoviricetes sp.]